MKQDNTSVTHFLQRLCAAVFGLAAICTAAPARAGDDAASPRPWDCDPVAWQEQEGGAFAAVGSGYALAPCPKGTEVEVSARVTPVSTDCPEYSNLGLSLFDDLDHRWNLFLSKKPDSKGGGTFCEMKNQRGGAWLDAPDGMAPALREGDGKWEWGRAYDMAMRLAAGSVEGEVRDAATGALVFRAVVSPAGADAGLEPGAPELDRGGAGAEPPSFAARPALVSAGDLRGRAENVRFASHGEVPDSWRAFPAYRPVGPGTGVRGEATGFFHAENIDGTDWAIDPLGRGVILAGVDWCNPRGSYSDFLGYSPYGRFVAEHYPSTEAWAEETDARLRSWGFTFLPCGGDESLYYRSLAHADGADRLYFSHRLCLGSADPEWRIAEYRRSPCTALPNVFHPRFQEACDWWARQRCAPNRDDPWLVGYFIDNELAWWGDVPENKAGGVFDAVMKKPDSHPAKKALLAFAEKHGGLEAAAQSATAKVEFLRLVAERYFAATTSAIRKADPNHMVLGCRFAGGPKHVHPVVMETAGKYCDVVSFNHYPWADLDRNAVFYAKIDKSRVLDVYREIHDLAGKPFILTEWGFSALDTGRPCTYGAGQRFYTQAERTQAAELFERTFLSLPFFIGHSFFRWADQPAVGKSKYFMENTNYGLVSEDGVPYRELTEMFARVQGDAVRWHGAPPPEERAEARFSDVPTERDRFWKTRGGSEAQNSSGETLCDSVALRENPDGSWVLSNGFVRISGRIGSRYMADEIAYSNGAVARARPVGRWGALLQGATDNIPWWVDVSRVTDVSFERDDATGIVTATIRAEGRGDEAVAGGSSPGGIGFAFTHRLSLAPGSPDILAEIASLENTGKEPFTVSYLFMRPFAVGNDFTDCRSVPNLWKGPVEGWWQFPDGSRWGVSSRDRGVVKATLWRREGETIQHPDVRCKDGEPFVLAPGETFRPRVPMGARIAFVPPAG